jgi:predicted GNAT family acetyltransferase
MNESTNDRTTVRHDASAARYELTVDGHVVCEADYHDAAGVRSFTHTMTDPARRGRGYAVTLVRAALDDTRAAGLTVIPACWFVRAFIDANAHYQDLLAA